MNKLYIFLIQCGKQVDPDIALQDHIMTELDDGILTYTYRQKLAKKIVDYMNRINKVKDLHCVEEGHEQKT